MRVGASACHSDRSEENSRGYAQEAAAHPRQVSRFRSKGSSSRMSILGVGSIAFDTITSPYGTAERVLGGSGTYFALAASYFTDVRIVAVVGDDFTPEHEDVFKRHGISTAGIQRAPGKTFFWSGEYGANVNEARTRITDLNVFERFEPQIPAEYSDT